MSVRSTSVRSMSAAEGFRFSRAWSIAVKEVRHVRRDPFTLAMALGMPILLVAFFGIVIDFDVHNIHLAAIDRDNSRASRELLRTFSSSNYFRVTPRSEGNPLSLLDQEKAKAVLVIEHGFEKDLHRFGAASAQVALDGADNQTAGIIAGYLSGVAQAAATTVAEKPVRMPVELRTRFLFNPELNSHWFIVPGLAVVVIGILSILLTALTVAREWENGSMELLLSTPVRPLEIIIGKLLPYTGLGLAAVSFVYVAARAGFGVPFRGSHLLFLLACFLFLGTTLAQGLVISVVTRQQQLAMQMANISGMLPSLMLSGFIFPIESMPPFFRGFTMMLAPRWFMTVIRGIFLRGAGLAELAGPLAALAAITAVLLFIATRTFKKDLEP